MIIIGILGIGLLAMSFILLKVIHKNKKLESIILEQKETDSKLLSQTKSSQVRLGQIAEHLVPFLKEFKHDPKGSHFIGNPIDYIIFEDDVITFLEIKTGESKFSSVQQNIKKLIDDKKIVFESMRIN